MAGRIIHRVQAVSDRPPSRDPGYHPAIVSKWSLFFAALGLAMFLEGLPYLISPAAVRRYLEMLQRSGDLSLRLMGLALIAAGLLVTYVATR